MKIISTHMMRKRNEPKRVLLDVTIKDSSSVDENSSADRD
jgi:hypothetical protein